MHRSASTPPVVTTTFVHLGYGVPGVLYEPETRVEASSTALFVMHADGDYLAFSAGRELAQRGYRVLCANNSTSKSGWFADGIFDDVLLQAGKGVEYLRGLDGVQSVVLFGHSGGATLMTAYQLIAEGGVAAGRGPEKIHQAPDELAGLRPADAVVLADANWGQSVMTLLSIDPAVTDEQTGMMLDPDLDMFASANGFDAGGSSYTPEFVARFQREEGERNNRILDRALERLELIEAGRGQYSDDEPFFVPGASFIGPNNKLYSSDLSLLSRSVAPWPLVHADGSSDTRIIRSVRPATNTRNLSGSLRMGALKTTVRNYLAINAVRVGPGFGYGETSQIRDVQWTSNYSNPPGNVQGIHVPLLVLGMTGGWEGLAAETIHDLAASPDKTIAFIEGATHMFTPCTRCEQTGGGFGDTVRTTYDRVDQWLQERGGRM